MASLSDILGPGSTAGQMFIWAVAQQVVTALYTPYLQQLQNQVNAKTPVVPLSAADAANAANRAFLDRDRAAAAAAQSGVSGADFDVMRQLAGNAPSPTDLVIALRRGLIPQHGSGADSTSFQQGIAEGNLLDKWTDVVAALAAQWPTPLTAVDATLKGQVTPDEGKTLYEKFGGDPQWFALLHDTAGSAPTPVEAVGMALRGIMPWTGKGPDVTSYEQAFLEGPWRDKWQLAFQQAALWWPTVAESLELYKGGQSGEQETATRLVQRGLTASQAAQWMGYADLSNITDYRGLTESAILDLVVTGLISDAQAGTMLAAIHKGPKAVQALIAYAHVQREVTSLNRAVSRIETLYADRKITGDTARNSLHRLNVPPSQVEAILAEWSTIAAVNVKTLTESQLADAFYYGLLDQGEATQELVNIGYTPLDAWIVLSNKAKQALPGRPAQGPAAPLGAVTPGTT